MISGYTCFLKWSERGVTTRGVADLGIWEWPGQGVRGVRGGGGAGRGGEGSHEVGVTVTRAAVGVLCHSLMHYSLRLSLMS